MNMGLGRWLGCLFSRCADVDVFYYVEKAESMSVMGSFDFSLFACCGRTACCVRREVITRIEEHMADGWMFSVVGEIDDMFKKKKNMNTSQCFRLSWTFFAVMSWL
jgi:hypothetical protein